MINLSQYFANGLFLQNIDDTHPFDAIIFEKFSQQQRDTVLADLTHAPNIYALIDDSNKNNQHNTTINDLSLIGLVEALAQTHTRILIVLDKLPLQSILPTLTRHSHISCINLHTGISSLGNKLHYEGNDIAQWIINTIPVLEPFDFLHAIDLLHTSEQCIMRLVDKELAQSILGNEQQDMRKLMHQSSLINMGNVWINGDVWTLLIGGSLLGETITALQSVNEQGKFFDLFSINNYLFSMSDELAESIEKTEHLITIIDQDNHARVHTYLKALLRSKQITDCEITTISPNTKKVTSTEPAYSYDQAWLWVETLVTRLMGIE